MKRLGASLLVLALAPALLTACSSGDDDTVSGSNTATAAASGSANDLSSVCPTTVVIQQDWEPEAEHSAAYDLVGGGYTVDAKKKRVTGPLVIDGQDTGVKIEVRAGGAAIGYQSVASQMYIDPSILLGAVTTDGAISASGKNPVTAVVAPLNKSPQMIMWDPKIAQQGFATAEPYIYQHEVQAWGKPVSYGLLADIGYNVYPEPLSVRSAEVSKNAPCLKKLVPILQRAQVSYLKDPTATNKVITDLVTKYNDGWTYSVGVADYAAEEMKALNIVANDTSGPLGGMDAARVQQSIDTFVPLLAKTGSTPKAGLKAADIIDTQFVDKAVKLS